MQLHVRSAITGVPFTSSVIWVIEYCSDTLKVFALDRGESVQRVQYNIVVMGKNKQTNKQKNKQQ